jgi:hypothetical protein
MANICKLGVYDGNATFGAASTMSYDSYYISWYPWTAGSVTTLCNTSRAKGRTPILTIKPTINPKITTAWQPLYTNLLDDIAEGNYDYLIQALCTDLKAYNGPVILRFAPRMDDLAKAATQPWVVNPDNGEHYATAYNRFTNVVKIYTHHLSQVQFMWSPDGGRYVAPYFPIPLDPVKYPNNVMTAGNVDYIGFNLFEYPEYDLAAYGFVRSFAQIYDALLQRFKLAQKPLIIEMACGAGSYQTAWTTDALTQLQNYANNPPAYSSANLVAAIWYNAVTTDTSWGYNLKAPDFSVSPSLWHL